MQILDKFRVNISLYNICDSYEEFICKHMLKISSSFLYFSDSP